MKEGRKVKEGRRSHGIKEDEGKKEGKEDERKESR
jgi:hypothetical protein